jgi:hypothetical protein
MRSEKDIETFLMLVTNMLPLWRMDHGKAVG